MAESKLANTIAKERVADLALRNGEPTWLKDAKLKSTTSIFPLLSLPTR